MKNCACSSPRPPLAPGVCHNAYVNPDSPSDRILFWHNIGRCSECDARKIWYSTADLEHNWSWKAATPGNHVGVLADPCMYLWPALRKELRFHDDGTGAVLWAEGEKDARAGRLLLRRSDTGGTATSHHGGAGKATEAQAEHFRGYRGRVLLAVDWDDAGAACGLRRRELLRGVGLREKQIQLVRAADGVGGGRGSGVDLADHLDAGYGLRDLVRLRPRDLAPAAERSAARQQTGWAYGGTEPPPGYSAEEWAADVRRSRDILRAHGPLRFNLKRGA